MSYLITPALLAIALLASTPSIAQLQITPTQEQGSSMVLEQRSISSSLKDVYGELNEQLRAVSKLATAVDPAEVEHLLQMVEEIKGNIAEAETALNRVRTADEGTWPAMKAELETLVGGMRSTVDVRNEALAAIFGGN